jgi:hypothetical protein
MNSHRPSGPPAGGSGRLGSIQPAPKENKKLASRHYNPLSSFTSFYSHLLADRYAKGLLTPFVCYRCGRRALDPIGFDGPYQPLCEPCSDPERMST